MLAGCKTWDRLVNFDFVDYPDSRVENLERLHMPSGKHRYTVTFVGDFNHAFNRQGHTIGGLRIGKPPVDSSSGTTRELPNPSASCLELVTELMEFDSSEHRRLEAVQVTWCARIIEDDPSALSRERAALALGPLGARVGVAGPLVLPTDAPRASAKETAQVLTDTVRTWRAWGENLATRDQWIEQANVLRETPFDLSGSRRVLPVLAGMMVNLPADSLRYETLDPLVREFERHTIQLALGKALREPTGEGSLVRAAAVRATVEAAGVVGLARLMPLLVAEREAQVDGDTQVKAAILGSIAKLGLPASIEGIPQADYDRIYENWLALLVGIAVEDKEGHVRVKSMQALGKLVAELDSLREEDWEEWFYMHEEQKREASGRAPTPLATEESGVEGQ